MKKTLLLGIVALVSIVFLAGLSAEAIVKNKAVEHRENKEPGYVYVTTEPAEKTENIKEDISKEKTPQYAPGKLIVKFKPGTSEVIRNSGYTVHARGLSRSINELNAKHKVKNINPVFKHLHKKDADGKFLTAKSQAQRTAGKFSKRQKRAPVDAKIPDLENIYILELEKDADILQSAADYQNDPNVEYAEPNYIYDTQMVPNDPYYSSSGSWGQSYDDLWGLKKIQCEEAWDISQGEGVVAAVIDTGIDYNHPDIANNIWINEAELNGIAGIDDDGNGYIDDVRGWDFVGADAYSPQADNDPSDGLGHGTHCAGTIAAVGNNGIGVIGVAPKAKVMAVKGLDDHGSGNDADLANCLMYAADMGADILSNSWGGPYSKTIENAVDYAYASGCVIVAAAGNSGTDINNWWWATIMGASATPANLKNTIAVAATNANDEQVQFSNRGVGVDIAAPGVDILSLRAEGTDMYDDEQYIVGERYYRLSGTSMACPHISGSAALILSAHPQFTNEDVRQALIATAEPIANRRGYGRANIYKALQIESPLRVEITYPIEEPFPLNHIRGIVDIMGTAAGDNLQNYKIECSDHSSQYLSLYWMPLFSSDSSVSNGLLFSWDTTSLSDNEYALRLTATDTNDNVFERKFLINIGNDYQMGWPVRTEGVTDSSPAFADIDGDGDQEVIAISGDNKVYAWHHNGDLVNGWPIYVPSLVKQAHYYISSPAVGDLDPSYPGLEIVAAGWNEGNNIYGGSYVYAWHCDGTSVDGWPARTWYGDETYVHGSGSQCTETNYINSSPALADIDEDGCLEVVVGGPWQRVWAFNHDGSCVDGWPVKVVECGRAEATPAIGDLDSNYPGLEIVIGTVEDAKELKSKVYALHNDGTLVPGWPIDIETVNFDVVIDDTQTIKLSLGAVSASAALGDLDRDGKLEVVVGAGNSKLYAWRHDGISMDGFPLQLV